MQHDRKQMEENKKQAHKHGKQMSLDRHENKSKFYKYRQEATGK
jgi:hypothetical protein